MVPTPEQLFGWSDFQLASMEDGVSYKAWGNVRGAGSQNSHAFPTKKEDYKQKCLKHLEKRVLGGRWSSFPFFSEGITKLIGLSFFCSTSLGTPMWYLKKACGFVRRCSKPKIRGARQ